MDYSQDFTLHIYSATAYEFLVNVAAPDLEIYGSTNMESEDASIICYSNPSKLLGKLKETIKAIVTQPMLQRRPNRTELRSMDSFIPILY